MVQTVDDDEKVRNNVPTLGGTQEVWFLTENGVYEGLDDCSSRSKKTV